MNGRLPGSEPSQQIGTLRCPRLAEALFERLPTPDRPCLFDQSIPRQSDRFDFASHLLAKRAIRLQPDDRASPHCEGANVPPAQQAFDFR